MPSAGVREKILAGLPTGSKGDGCPMDNCEDPRVMTRAKGKATVNSNIEARASHVSPFFFGRQNYSIINI